MQRISVIINPISGSFGQKNTKHSLIKSLRHYAQRKLLELTIYRTHKAKQATELAAKAIQNGNDLVICCGGDGSINETALALLGTQIPLAIIPAGSGNGLARHIGIPLSARPALNIALHGVPQPMDCGIINGHHFFTTAGIGLDAEVGWLFNNLNTRGMLNYVRATMQLYFKYPPRRYSINVDGQDMEVDALMITFANASQFGNNAIISPNANISDGFLDLVIVHPFPKTKTFNLITMLFNKTIDRSPFVTTIRFKQLHIETTQPTHGHIDGEPIRLPNAFDVSVIPSCLLVQTPLHRNSIPLFPPPSIHDALHGQAIERVINSYRKNQVHLQRIFEKRMRSIRKSAILLRKTLRSK